MKKMTAFAAAATLALTAIPGAIAGAPKQQTVEGSIALPAPYTDDSGCFAGVHRRQNAVTMGNANGVVGYSFEVDKKTWKKPFVLETSGGAGTVDLDITFYLGPLTTLDDIVSTGGDPAPPATVQYATRAAGGEADVVPEAAENVIICMYGGGQGAGFGANFTYTAGKGVKLPKG